MLRTAVAGGVAVALSCAVAPDAHAAQARTVQPVRGLDISAYQHTGTPINWPRLARDGVRFVSVKASEGTYYLNPYYASDTRAAKAAGLAVLPYVFANPASAGGKATARFAIKATGITRRNAGLPLVVDLENDPYKKNADCYQEASATSMNRWIAGFVNQVRALTGRYPVIYTTAAWWRECTGSTGQFRHDPLWLAAYGGNPASVPSPWSRWAFLQYADNGSLPGIGPVDLDYYKPTDGLPALWPAKQTAKEKAAAARKKAAAAKAKAAKAKVAAAKHPAAKRTSIVKAKAKT
ncbi:MAG TPA: GH25 family lysozyme [Trebonia sp.]|jgi:lysozyme